ncbi:MAG: hypothetical protein OXU61_13180 [Gammaproteobacteria bacterium]|nr:hypothetical protein [Gammaproteobacteria bacterium]
MRPCQVAGAPAPKTSSLPAMPLRIPFPAAYLRSPKLPIKSR